MTERGLTVSSPARLLDGSTSWTDDEYLRDTWVLPDWTIVDSPGLFYTRWGAGGRAGMELAPSVRAGARIADSRSYASGSEVSVRIWRTWNEYRDVTEMLDADSGMPILKIAENMPGSASICIDADWETASANPLSSAYGGWARLVSGIGTDAAGAVRTGMYLTVHILKGGAWTMVWGGHISTMTPDAGRLRIEAADGLAVLARQGATLRRNYYDQHTRTEGDATYSGGRLYGSLSRMPEGSVPDQASYLWKVMDVITEDDTIDGSKERPMSGFVPQAHPSANAYEYARWEWTAQEDCILHSVTAHWALTDTLAGDVRGWMVFECKTGGRAITEDYTFAWGVLANEYTHEFVGDLDVAEGDHITVRWMADQYVHIAFWTGPVAEDSPIRGKWWVESDWFRSKCPDWDVSYYTLNAAAGVVEGSQVRITSIDGVRTSDFPKMADPPQNRFEYAYYTAGDPRDVILADLVTGFGGLPFIAGSTAAELGVYRIGGGYMRDYLVKIADVGEAGDRRTVTARGFTVMAVASGIRHERSDEPMMAVCRNASATGAPSGAVEFVSLTPRMTLKNRPSLAVLRGAWEAGEESIPMMVAVEAEGISEDRGIVLETVVTDSEAADVRSAMRAAWAALAADSLDVWEGTVVIPGFHPELIEASGINAGSGAVIAIYDERYGLSGYPVIVKDLKADWGAWTTELTVTSHGPAYSSLVPDTAAVAQMAGDLATGSGLLYQTQYVRVVTSEAVAGATRVEVATEEGAEDGEWWECSDVSTGIAGSRAIVTARIWASRGQRTDYFGKYAVAKIRIDGETVITIDPYRRPDLYDGQVLIVQIDASAS